MNKQLGGQLSKVTPSKVIAINAAKCTGCHSCEMACSLKHFGVCSIQYSRIRVLEFKYENVFVPLICQACEKATCIYICPMNARSRLSNGAIITDEQKCIGCKGCISACPFGIPVMNPETGKAMSCDYCLDSNSEPWCVKACQIHKALEYVNTNNIATPKRKDWAYQLKKLKV